MKMVHRADIQSTAYDLVTDDGLVIRLTRHGDGRWRFDEIALPTGDTFGGSESIHQAAVLAWLEASLASSGTEASR